MAEITTNYQFTNLEINYPTQSISLMYTKIFTDGEDTVNTPLKIVRLNTDKFNEFYNKEIIVDGQTIKHGDYLSQLAIAEIKAINPSFELPIQ